MTTIELKTLINTAGTAMPDIPATYGNILLGVWTCPTEGCPCELVPRTLRIVLPDGHLPFPCPLCNGILEYDEQG